MNHNKIDSILIGAYAAKCDCCNNIIDLNPIKLTQFNLIENPQVAIFGMVRNDLSEQNTVSQTLTNTVLQTSSNTAQSPEERHSLNKNHDNANCI